MGIQELSRKIYDNPDDVERMEAMNDIIYDMVDFIRDNAPNAYEHFLKETEDVLYNITEEEAVGIVRTMRPYGEHWTVNDVNNYVRSMGQEPCVDWYLTMNMAFNDYSEIAYKNNIDVTEFCYDVARCFIKDEDAMPHKVSRYFMK